MTEIDWEEQWRNFSPEFYDGLAHIDLGGPILCLKPGGGFGDFSHPTTRLVISLMADRIKDKVVIDIGCGSGILSIAAVLLGAKSAYGIDIDEEAIRHSKENAVLNKVQDKTRFSIKLDSNWIKKEPCIILMNMIESEQQAAWEALPQLHDLKFQVIASGILTSQKERYIKLLQSWSWILREEKKEEGWSAFVFDQPS
jgi:ribosomal protein L11 methyltransferase